MNLFCRDLSLDSDGDYSAWVDLMLSSLDSDPEAFYVTTEVFSAMSKTERLALFEGIRFLGVSEKEPDTELVGLVGFGHSDNGGSGPEGIYVRNMYVDTSRRGSGVAELLLSSVEKKAKSEGTDDLLLSVYDTQERAIRFYEKAGYNKIRQGESDSKPGANWVLMKKSLHLGGDLDPEDAEG